MIGAAEQVEVVDIGRAEVGLDRIGDVLDGNAELLRLDLIDVDEDLRRVRGERREHGGGEEQRRLARCCDEFVGRRRQQLRTTALPVLDAHGETAAGADARDRRRWDHDDEGASDGRQPLAQIRRDHLRVEPLLEAHLRFFEHWKQRRRVARLSAGRSRQTRKDRDMRNSGRIERDALDPPNDLGGPRQRGRARQLRGYDHVAAILCRNVALGRGDKQPAGAADQDHIHEQHHHAMPDHEACDVSIKMRQPVKAAVEQPGEPSPAARDQIPSGRWPLLFVRNEDLRSQCRRQGQRTEAGDCCRDRDGDRELLEELPGNATEKRGRHEHSAQHQRDRHQRATDLLHRLQRGIAPAQALREMPLDILDHDNGVVDHDANREHKAEQRQIVDGIAERGHRSKSSDQRHRNRHDRDDRRPPALQEHQHHDNDQQHRLVDGLDQFVDRLGDEFGRVIADIVVEPLGEAGLQLLHRVLDALGSRKRVRSWPLRHPHRNG